MPDATGEVKASTGYDEDFYLWAQEQAQLLREGRFADLDLDHLIDEVESVGRSDKREIRSRLEVLIAHLLKWKYQPDGRKPGWMATIVEQRQALRLVLDDSPSLRRYPADVADLAARSGRLLASRETGIALALFPETCPFSIDQVLDVDFLPDEPAA